MSDSELHQYRFKIDAFSVESLPMSRLAEYMMELAKLLGEEERIHFSHLESGSAILVANAEEPAAPKVAERIRKVNEGTAPVEAMNAFRRLDTMLAKDNAVGDLSNAAGAQIISFPGRTRPKPVRYGPFKERGSLDGVVIRLGGKDDTIPVLLQDGEATVSCQTSIELSKRLAAYYRAEPVRVYGDGSWVREEDGTWRLIDFYIQDFEVLDDRPLGDVVGQLRAVEGSRWSESPDAISDILSLRREKGDQH